MQTYNTIEEWLDTKMSVDDILKGSPVVFSTPNGSDEALMKAWKGEMVILSELNHKKFGAVMPNALKDGDLQTFKKRIRDTPLKNARVLEFDTISEAKLYMSKAFTKD